MLATHETMSKSWMENSKRRAPQTKLLLPRTDRTPAIRSNNAEVVIPKAQDLRDVIRCCFALKNKNVEKE